MRLLPHAERHKPPAMELATPRLRIDALRPIACRHIFLRIFPIPRWHVFRVGVRRIWRFEHVFGELGRHRIHASVDPRNLASMTMLRALGMRQEAHHRESLWLRGEWVDDVIFAMLASEWPPHQTAGVIAVKL
jgi:hypothetical protein